MSAPGRPQALIPEPHGGEGTPLSAPGRPQALMPEPLGGEGTSVSAPGRPQALIPEPHGGEGTPVSESAAESIERRLRQALDPVEIEVRDDSALHAGHAGAREGGHFAVRLRCARFGGLSRLARHRLVYDALGPLAPQRIHALAIDARAPDEA